MFDQSPLLFQEPCIAESEALQELANNPPEGYHPRSGDPKLSQYFTQFWVAEACFNRYFPNLGQSDLLLEPSCGLGPFLAAVPDHIRAIGIEIDPAVAEEARINSGRQVITGDFTKVELEEDPTALFGNPPFEMELFKAFLNRAHDLLPKGGPVGMIVPGYFFQSATTVMEYREKWGLFQEAIPRTIFPRLKEQLMFAIWEKDTKRFDGFFLYEESHAFVHFAARYKRLLGQNSKNTWKALVELALKALGGEASLQQLYKLISPKRPISNRFWREKVRQTAARYCTRVGKGRYALAAPAVAAA